MAGDLSPDDLLASLGRMKLAPFYLFYGPDEFRLERLLQKIREVYVPEAARDFNLEICYGGETDPSEIIHHAQTMPFMADNRLIVVRRTEEFKADQLNRFLPYLERPSPSTCLIFIASKTDFKTKFFKTIRSSGSAVYFGDLKMNQVVAWIKGTGKELGIDISTPACVYLQQIIGNKLADLYSELVKLQLRHGAGEINEKQVRELAIQSRVYSIFELMDAISEKDCGESLSILKGFLEEEDKKSGPLQVIGMLNRQIRFLWQTKVIADKGGKSRDVASKLGLHPYPAGNFLKQSRKWSADELERGISLLYEADKRLKSGSRQQPVLENLIISLCG
jgi:DNA polymerase-3 subunit delta